MSERHVWDPVLKERGNAAFRKKCGAADFTKSKSRLPIFGKYAPKRHKTMACNFARNMLY